MRTGGATIRQKLITLCPTTFELASKKPNFSDWVRDKLRSERNRLELTDQAGKDALKIIKNTTSISNHELLYHVERRSPEEIKALIAILRNGLQ